MSPTQSITGRLRSGSKSSGALSRANSTRSKPETIDGEAFPNLSSLSGSFLSRNGPGKGSVRSVRSLQSVHSIQSNRSGPVPLAEIVEMEPPKALTMAAMDEADRTAPKLEDLADDDDSILARAHQHVEPDATDIEVAEGETHHLRIDFDRTPVMDDSAESYWDNHEGTNLQVRNFANPPSARIQDGYDSPDQEQHEASGNHDSDDEENVFADFDGMHCDPDTVAELFPHHPEEEEYHKPPQRNPQMRRPPAARPQSYFDPETNQQMLYYPARVPAMLNLPPKLGKGLKAAEAARQARRSQVLSQMPKAARESRFWLPDPLESEAPTNLMGDDRPISSQQSTAHGQDADFVQALAALEGPGPETPQDPLDEQHLRRPPKLGDGGARQSRINLSELPPQLRASVFFDMPAQSVPSIVVQNGSATATLDSILDAAAAAPVNAFTDHAFAGHLGSEVYGPDRRNNRKSQLMLTDVGNDKSRRLTKSTAALVVPEVAKRKSVWSLLPGRKSKSSVNLLNAQEEDARSKRSGSGQGDSDSLSDVDEHSALAPDDQERSTASDDEQLYNGPPTTLLAELQMRKRQHEMRTKNPLHQGNALHSTLLELDAVAQVEARKRDKKEINLAWNGDTPEEASDEDEDVPLGLLAAKKQLGPNATELDMAVMTQEINRPLGLMERRDMDDNEPLSRRRDRLQGRPVPVSMYLQPGGNGTRLTVLGGSNSGPVSPRLMQPVSPALSGTSQPQSTTTPEEVEGETLGERMRRLRAQEDGDNPLPRARPISRGFSEELLAEFGTPEEPEKDKGKGKENAAPVVEEEETLGQRRRRLQAEREAREKEMGIRAVSGDEQQQPTISKRMSMADVLGSNPLEGPEGRMDPREAERLRRGDETVRAGREQHAKLAAFRSQMPAHLGDPSAGQVRSGGYASGRFNDGVGGLLGPGGHQQQQMSRNQHIRASMSMSQLGHYNQGPQHVQSSTHLVGAAGNYGPQPEGLNPVFAKSNPFGNGYNGGFLQNPQFQQPQPFVSGTLLAPVAVGGGYGVGGGYAQTAYGGGVGYAPSVMPGYAPNAGGMQMPMMGGQAPRTDRVERWRQSIR